MCCAPTYIQLRPSLSRQRIRCAVERGLPLARLTRAQQQPTGFQLRPKAELLGEGKHFFQHSQVTTKGKQFALK